MSALIRMYKRAHKLKNEHSTEQRESRIPQFATREQEAAFWDTRDISEYWDELKPVQLNVAKNLSREIRIITSPPKTPANYSPPDSPPPTPTAPQT